MLLLRTHRGMHTSVHTTCSWTLQWTLDLRPLFRGNQLRNPPFSKPNHGGGSHGNTHEPLQKIHSVETTSKSYGAFDISDATDFEAQFRFSLKGREVDANKSDEESLSPAATRSHGKLPIFPLWFVNHQRYRIPWTNKTQSKLNILGSNNTLYSIKIDLIIGWIIQYASWCLVFLFLS